MICTLKDDTSRVSSRISIEDSTHSPTYLPASYTPCSFRYHIEKAPALTAIRRTAIFPLAISVVGGGEFVLLEAMAADAPAFPRNLQTLILTIGAGPHWYGRVDYDGNGPSSSSSSSSSSSIVEQP